MGGVPRWWEPPSRDARLCHRRATGVEIALTVAGICVPMTDNPRDVALLHHGSEAGTS